MAKVDLVLVRAEERQMVVLLATAQVDLVLVRLEVPELPVLAMAALVVETVQADQTGTCRIRMAVLPVRL